MDELVNWDWIGRNLDDVWTLTREHVVLSVLPVAFGLAIAFPLAILVRRYPRLYGPLLTTTGVLFTIPSLALFVLVLPFTGLTPAAPLLALTVYTLLVLLRNTVEGLRSVPSEVIESAQAMGYTSLGLLLRVELPLALPVVIAGVRIATVTSIGIVAVASVIGQGGLGELFYAALQRFFLTPALVGTVVCVALALLADFGLLSLQRALTPWTRRTR